MEKFETIPAFRYTTDSQHCMLEVQGCPSAQDRNNHTSFLYPQKHDLDVACANIFTIESPENKITHLKRKATASRLCAHWVAPWLPIYGRHVLVLLSSPNGFQACAKLSYVKLQTRWLFEYLSQMDYRIKQPGHYGGKTTSVATSRVNKSFQGKPNP